MREYFIWLAKFVTLVLGVLLVIGVLVGMVAAGVSSQMEFASTTKAKTGIGIVELNGIIESSDEVLRELYKFIADDDIYGIVLEIDSPGGAVAPSQAIFSAVRKLREVKPIAVVMGAVAASGGCYSALGATKVYAQPGTLTGSIGVILQIPNFEDLSKKIGVDMITIKSGALKDAGNSFRAMTAEERAYLQRTADEAHEVFITDVATARNIPVETVRKFADGRVILGTEAKELGLVDAFGDTYDAARELYSISAHPLEKGEVPNLIRKEDRFGEFRKLLGAWTSLPTNMLSGMGLRAVSEIR